jgi:cytochrome P450
MRPGLPLLGNVVEFRRRPLGLLLELQEQHRDIAFLDLAGIDAHAAFAPDLAAHVLQKNARNYTKDTPAYRVLRLMVGDGLLTSDGDLWLRQRRIAQPAFQRRRIEGFDGTMLRVIRDTESSFRAAARAGRAIDVHAEMMRLTLRIAGLTLMSADIDNEDSGSVGEAVSWLLEEMNRRILLPHGTSLSPLQRSNRRFVHYREQLFALVRRIIADRRAIAEDAAPDDLLSMFMHATDPETGERMDDQQLLDELLTMLAAGHETTANLLSFFWVAMHDHPEIAESVADEVRRVLGDEPPRGDDLHRLPLLHDVVLETLRLYPPVWVVGRSPAEDDELGGHAIRAGSIVFVSPWAMHRHPDYWDEPTRFDPGRFSPERSAARPKHAFLPFVTGPRMCIGSHFALVEAMLAIAWLVPRFALWPQAQERLVLDPVITLRPGGPVRMYVRERHRG